VEGEVQAAASRAPSARVRETQRAYPLHRDINAAWNLWAVAAAEVAGLPRPAHLTRGGNVPTGPTWGAIYSGSQRGERWEPD